MSSINPTSPGEGIPASRGALDAARARVVAAVGLLAEWHGRQTDVAAGRTYVAAGHECIDRIDDALRSLYEARGGLVDEIRRDEDERAVRVDRMLAEAAGRTERVGREVSR